MVKFIQLVGRGNCKVLIKHHPSLIGSLAGQDVEDCFRIANPDVVIDAQSAQQDLVGEQKYAVILAQPFGMTKMWDCLRLQQPDEEQPAVPGDRQGSTRHGQGGGGNSSSTHVRRVVTVELKDVDAARLEYMVRAYGQQAFASFMACMQLCILHAALELP